MSDTPNSDQYCEVLESWLCPSEALTRFVPTGTIQNNDARPITPNRFGARVGDIGLLVPMGMLSEVVEEPKIYPLPTTPQWFHGLINLRGSLVPVYNLKLLFQLDDQGTESTNLLVLNIGEAAVGFLIDGLPVTLTAIQRMEQFPMLPPVLRDYGQAIYVQDGAVWVDFEFDEFFRAASAQTVARTLVND